ncbi:hypothetical protein JCM3765_002474 [Sporobolomyces pararoseus]
MHNYHPPAPVEPPVVNDDPCHGVISRPSRAAELNRQSWRNWTLDHLIPTVEAFVQSHASTTLPLGGHSAPLGVRSLGSNYRLTLDKVLFREDLPQYPLGLPHEAPRVIEVRLPGIRIETATLSPEHVIVPAQFPAVGLHPVQPPRQSVMFLPSNSRREHLTERAGPRVFEYFEHIPPQPSTLSSYPIQCRGENGSLDLLERGVFSRTDPPMPWTYLFTNHISQSSYWTAAAPHSLATTSNWHVRFYNPPIIADITFELPPSLSQHQAPPQFHPEQR